MSSLAALVSRGGVFRFLWGCALFCVLCRRRRLALAFAPPLTKTGLWQWRDAAPCLPRRRACAYANLIAPRSGSCHRRGSSPRQMRTRHLQEQPVIYFCEKFEEHSLLASVLKPLACPSSGFKTLRVVALVTTSSGCQRRMEHKSTGCGGSTHS